MSVSAAAYQCASHARFHMRVDVPQTQHAAVRLRLAAFDEDQARDVIR